MEHNPPSMGDIAYASAQNNKDRLAKLEERLDSIEEVLSKLEEAIEGIKGSLSNAAQALDSCY